MSDVFADGEARILDRGFRHYDGERSMNGAVRTVFVQGVQRALGFRRKVAAKVLPYAAIAIAFVPAIVMIGLASMFRSGASMDLELPTYSDYLQQVSVAILLLTSIVAPEVFGNDQRNGMLGIYLASPLTRTRYLAAKTASVFVVLAVITTGPQILLLIANTVQGVGPDHVGDWLVVFLRILASGAAVAALLTAMSVAATVLANNKGIATAAIVTILLIVSLIATSLGSATGVQGWRVFSVLEMALVLPTIIHGEALGYDQMSATTAWIGWVLWLTVCSAVAWYRLQRIEVAR